MTINTETVHHRGVAGDHRYAVVTLDITSLAAAGAEAYDAGSKHSIDDVWGATVLGQENPGYVFGYDPDAGNVTVQYADYDAAADGTLIDVPSTTDVGTVTLKFQGGPSA